MNKLTRYHLGRVIIHIGIAVMPPGRPKSELYNLLDQWASHVRDVVRRHDSERQEGAP